MPAGPASGIEGEAGRCAFRGGPDECPRPGAGELFEAAIDGHHEGDVRALARQFDGAWPYLELIARANGRPDPLDPQVVEAYWLGNPLLDQVEPVAVGSSLQARFRPRLRADAWRWLADTPRVGAKPVHAFHVMDVFPRTGLMRDDHVADVLKVIDDCRIRWGRVMAVEGDWLVASVVPIRLVDGKLALVEPQVERVQAWRDGTGFIDQVEPGDTVSIHWNWACERLDSRRLANLMGWTKHQLEIANLTV